MDLNLTESPKVAELKRRVAELSQRVADLEKKMHDEAEGALLHLTAVVAHAVGVDVAIGFTNLDMLAATNLQLERADLEDGGMALLVTRKPEPQEPSLILEHKPVLAKAERPIILLDPNRPPGE
jgi:hypothetical protein